MLALLVVVAAGAGIGVGALLWAGGPETPVAERPPAYPSGYVRLTPEEYDRCVREVSVHFDGDAPDPVMRAAADRLRDDPRFESARPRTRQESYEEFRRVFADQPEVVALARPESLPATVILLVRRGGVGVRAQGDLRAEFPDAEVAVQKACPR
ncbi:hypothetical protein CFN78_21955 [Amycolatopsis antarctica]|uniref:FtsX extracellular domain-containing protein n=1 Tax=Amycolatopsis antarctica TaxID=1854586 RepID=A0A263CY96_9PSEU|nr:hypothetical protein CFN78_21955 [Amycolatopsis antarctica]